MDSGNFDTSGDLSGGEERGITMIVGREEGGRKEGEEIKEANVDEKFRRI